MLYCIKDVKVGTFDRLFEARNDAEAIRNLEVLFRSNEKTLMTMYPSDFILYRVGDFDKTTGLISGAEVPEVIIVCDELVSTAPEVCDSAN